METKDIIILVSLLDGYHWQRTITISVEFPHETKVFRYLQVRNTIEKIRKYGIEEHDNEGNLVLYPPTSVIKIEAYWDKYA